MADRFHCCHLLMIAGTVLGCSSVLNRSYADEPVTPVMATASRGSSSSLLQHQLYARTIDSAWHSWQRGEVNRARALLQQSDRNLRSWEYDYLQCEFERSERTYEVTSYGRPVGIRYVTFSPDGSLLAACSDDLHVRVWQLENDQLLFDVKDETRTVEFDPEGLQLVTGISGRMNLRDSRSGSLVDHFRISDSYTAGMPLRAQFSPDGDSIAVQGYQGGVHLVDAVSVQNLHSLKDKRFTGSFRFHPTDKVVAIATYTWEKDPERRMRDGIELYDLSGKTPTVKTRIEVNQLHHLKSLHFSPDGSLIAVCGYLNKGYGLGRCEVYDIESAKLRYVLTNHQSHLSCVRFSPDGTRLATGSLDGTVQIWDGADGSLIDTFRGHTDPVRSVAFRPGGQMLASGSEDGTIRLWDLEQPYRGNRHRVKFPSYSYPNLTADSHRVYAYWRKYDQEDKTYYSEIQPTDIRSGRALPPMQSPHGAEIIALTESYDSRLVAQSLKRYSNPNAVEVGNIDANDSELPSILITQRETNQPVNEIECSPIPHALRFSRDHKCLYSIGPQVESFKPADFRTPRPLKFDVIRKEVATGNELFRKTIEVTGLGQRFGRLEASPDGSLLAAVVIRSTDLNQLQGIVYLFDAKTGQKLGELVEPDAIDLDFRFSPDGHRLATAVQKKYEAEFRGYVSLWDLNRKEQTLTIPAHRTHIHAIAFTPDGRRIVSAGGWHDMEGGEISFWDPETGERVFQLDDFSSAVIRLAFDPVDRTLVAVEKYGTVNILKSE